MSRKCVRRGRNRCSDTGHSIHVFNGTEVDAASSADGGDFDDERINVADKSNRMAGCGARWRTAKDRVGKRWADAKRVR